jgi:hypothetical protein
LISQMIHEYHLDINRHLQSIISSIDENSEENKWCITIRVVKKDLNHKHGETE